MVQLVPEGGSAADALTLQMGTLDFYVSLIGGQAFTRYASTIDTMQIDAATLNNAIRSVRTATGSQRFELQSLLVFCVAESIRSQVEHTSIIRDQQVLRATISIGIISSVNGEHSLDKLLKLADQAQYRAKSNGKNCVCSSITQ